MKKKNTNGKNFEFGQVMSMLESMDDGIKVIGEQHSEIVGRLDRMQDDITDIKHRLSEKVDRGEFDKMEKRVVRLEKLAFAKMH